MWTDYINSSAPGSTLPCWLIGLPAQKWEVRNYDLWNKLSASLSCKTCDYRLQTGNIWLFDVFMNMCSLKCCKNYNRLLESYDIMLKYYIWDSTWVKVLKYLILDGQLSLINIYFPLMMAHTHQITSFSRELLEEFKDFFFPQQNLDAKNEIFIRSDRGFRRSSVWEMDEWTPLTQLRLQILRQLSERERTFPNNFCTEGALVPKTCPKKM